MARYLITCNVDSSSDISLRNGALGGGPWVNCPDGSLEVFEYQPSISQLPLDEINQYLEPIFMLVFVAWTLGLLLKFLKSQISFFK